MKTAQDLVPHVAAGRRHPATRHIHLRAPQFGRPTVLGPARNPGGPANHREYLRALRAAEMAVWNAPRAATPEPRLWRPKRKSPAGERWAEILLVLAAGLSVVAGLHTGTRFTTAWPSVMEWLQRLAQ